MWWILSGLVLLLVWALKLIFQAALSIWVPVVATIVIVVFMVALLIFRRVREGRAASALEKAIAAQGAQQALNAKPERRAEIQELQRQVQTGINALKSSKLGRGKKGGMGALYSLPWYVIIGPPGAGKTTALKHSGLVFPHQDAGGVGGVRGVGGTRNCDWWFTNEAILLDTAGRYTTESDDRDEWLAFLQMLRKYRSRRPINGVLVAISVAELIDAGEHQLEATGKKIRARIDEVMTQLHMVVPVYVLFTKCDLIAGFNEFFGDLRKSDRAQAWGTTLRLDLAKNDPGKMFEAEFDVLAKQVHARALKRLAMERSREAREKVFQFPLEFAGIKRNLAELVAATFQVNAFQGTPIFRGFYFTSGTQEGRPLDRVLGRMGHAMGIRPPETAASPVVESKSYFLHDVFMNVVFPDGDIAARTRGELRRQAVMRVAVSLVAASLAMILAVPGCVSFSNNRALIKETEAQVRAASVIDWTDRRPPTSNFDLLDPVLKQLEKLDDFRDDGEPLGMGWMMYRGEVIARPTADAYVRILQKGFVLPCRARLEERLRRVHGDNYLAERTDLKTYLMLSDVEHLDVEWATGRFTNLWVEILKPTSNVTDAELRKRIVDHVHYYFTLLKGAKVTPTAATVDVVESARKTLMGVPVRKRYYDLFVNSLTEEKYDVTGDNVGSNRKYPPITLADVFIDRADVLKVVTSAQNERDKHWKEVFGQYTERGHYRVVKNVADGAGLLERERWVVPLTNEETPDRIAENLKYLAEDYDQRYIEQWTDFLRDIVVKSPTSAKDAIEIYTALTLAPLAYVRIFRQIEDHTQWRKSAAVLESQEGKQLTKLAETKVKTTVLQQTGFTVAVDLKKVAGRASTVPEVFKRTVEFGVPPVGATGSGAEVPLNRYISKMDKLRSELLRMSDNNGNVEPRQVSELLDDATKDAQGLLQASDDKAKTLLTPLLLNPLKIGTAKGPGAPAPSRRAPGRMPSRR